MSAIELPFIESLLAIRVDAQRISTWDTSSESLDDDEVLRAQHILTDARRWLDSAAATLAGEVAHRSRRELGLNGLAQRQGFRTAEKLVQHSTGSTARDAATLVTVGRLVRDAESVSREAGAPTEPWLVAVGAAVRAGTLSLHSADAIRIGMGLPTEGLSAETLATAITSFLAEASQLNADQVLTRARQLRDDLDVAGVALREEQIHNQRSFRRVRRSNGLHC